MEQSTSSETNYSAGKEIPRLNGTRRFITVLSDARFWFLSWTRIQSTPTYLLTYSMVQDII